MLGELGRGGIAIVYRVRDEVSGREVALKRLKRSGADRSVLHALELFEHEYHVLSQLAHPRVVEVYDYQHRDGEAAFYTMELLDGGDLMSLSPLDHRRACAIVSDVCSALCLVHSRGYLHRDLSPHNIRCTTDGKAKLIDFGAVVAMSSGHKAVGTPPYCPPEVLDMQQLDARTDLYSLGTSLYYALTGRQAYPARDFRALRVVWQAPPPPPSELVPGIPTTLDDLVMELMQLEPQARPANAADVMERVIAIAGLPVDEQLRVSQAYLTTPVLVGRDHKLSRVTRRLIRGQRGEGSVMLVQAEPGLGRTRFLDACALKAKLVGSTVARAGQADTRRGAYGPVQALCLQLLEAHPQSAQLAAARDADVLSHVLPELAGSATELRRFDSEADKRERVQECLHRWILEVGGQHPLVLVVDDIDTFDEPSTAFLALLAEDARHHSLAILASAGAEELEQRAPALKLLSGISTSIVLRPLSLGESEALFASIFGRVPHLDVVASRLHELAGGNPRDLLQLAQHLLDRGVVSYGRGCWSLPSAIDEADLPASMFRALFDRVEALDDDARILAQGFSLACDEQLALHEALILAAHGDRARLARSLSELAAAGVVRATGDRYALGQAGWIPALQSLLEPERGRQLHARLAAIFERRADRFRTARHRIFGGEGERGLALLIEHARDSKEITVASQHDWMRLLDTLPRDWHETYRAALELCEELQRPRIDRHTLLARLPSIVNAQNQDGWSLISAVIEQYARDCGLDIARELEALPSDPGERVRLVLKLAKDRHDALPPSERVHAPTGAVAPLVPATFEALGMASNHFDRARWAEIPSLQLLQPLSPVIAMVESIREALGERLAGRVCSAASAYERLVARLEQPDHAGLTGTHYHVALDSMKFVRGMLQAMMGSPQALETADTLEASEYHQLSPMLLRTLYWAWQGDGVAADRCRRQLEVTIVRRRFPVPYEGVMLFTELCAVVLGEDLTKLRGMLPRVQRWAERFEAWRPMLCYARGAQYRIGGDFARALDEVNEGLAQTAPGQHQLWPTLAGNQVECLLRTEQSAEAVAAGRHHLAQARAHDLDFFVIDIKLPLALALAQHGEGDAARGMAEEVVEELEGIGSTGIRIGLAYLVLSRVCVHTGDAQRFEQASRRGARMAGRSGNQALVARYKALMREARKAHRSELTTLGTMTSEDWQSGAVTTFLATAFESCGSLEQRGELVARLLAEYCKAVEVRVFVPQRGGQRVRLIGCHGCEGASRALIERVGEYLECELERDDATVTGEDIETCTEAVGARWRVEQDKLQYPALVGHREAEGFVVGAVAVLTVSDGQAFVHPGRLAGDLSRLGLSAGSGVERAVIHYSESPVPRRSERAN